MPSICDQLEPIYDDYTSSYLSEVGREEFLDLLDQGIYKRCVPKWSDSPGDSPCFLDQSFDEMEMGQCGDRFQPYNLVVLGRRGSNSYEESQHCAALSTALPPGMTLDEDYEAAYYFPSDQCRRQRLPILAEYIGAYGDNRYFIAEDRNQFLPYSGSPNDCGVGEQTYGGVPEDQIQEDPRPEGGGSAMLQEVENRRLRNGIIGALVGGSLVGAGCYYGAKAGKYRKEAAATGLIGGGIGLVCGWTIGRALI